MEKIIQIMAAPKDMYAKYRNDEDHNDPILNKVICLGLSDQGEVYLMDMDDWGSLDIAERMSNFEGVVWKGYSNNSLNGPAPHNTIKQ